MPTNLIAGLFAAALTLDAPVLVLDLDAVVVAPSDATVMRDAVIAALGATGVRTVTPKEQLEAARAKTCREDPSCLADLAKSESAGFLVTGSLGKVGAQLVLGLSLVDMRTSRVVARAGASDPSLSALSSRAGEIVAQLFDPPKGAVPTVPLSKNPRFVILEIGGAGLSDEVAKNLIHVVASELRRIPGSAVLSRDEVQAMLGAEQLRQVLDASCDRACFSRLAGALDADYVVTGQVGLLEQTYVVSLAALDQRTDGSARRVTETYEGSADELLRATRHAVQSLFGLVGGTGALTVGATENGATVLVDNERVGELPLPPLTKLAPGRYTVAVEKGGFDTWRTDVYVNPEDTSVVWAELAARPEAWFEKWWVWTIVGVAVAGSTAGIIAATSGDSGVGRVTVGVR
ncbi:PEGA domain-containing protein [Myxococcota bacterium]|nr:PEGA domain-containing protein [Myxococcota bacterium]